MHDSGRFNALKNWVLTTDYHQRTRMVMTGISALIAMCCIVITNLAAVAGTTPTRWMLLWSVVACIGFVVPIVLIRSGWSQRLSDPALTQFQVRFALLSNAVAYVLLGPARGISLVLLSLIMLFVVFDVSPRQMAANMGYALTLFGAAFFTVAWLDEPYRQPVVEKVYAAMVVIVLLGITFITVRLNKIRQRLKRQKIELTEALAYIQ